MAACNRFVMGLKVQFSFFGNLDPFAAVFFGWLLEGQNKDTKTNNKMTNECPRVSKISKKNTHTQTAVLCSHNTNVPYFHDRGDNATVKALAPLLSLLALLAFACRNDEMSSMLAMMGVVEAFTIVSLVNN